MARINLLPWRAERRAARQKEFYTLLGLAAVAGILIAFAINYFLGLQIEGQQARNEFLQQQIGKVKAENQEIAELDKKKSRLLARKEVIEQLQGNRSRMVHLFDSLVRTIPDGVILTSIRQSGESMTLEGRAQSNARVSTYMRNLETSGWMTNPELTIIEARSDAPRNRGGSKVLPYQYILTVKLGSADENRAAAGDAESEPELPPAVQEAAAELATPASVAAAASGSVGAPATAPVASPDAASGSAPATQTRQAP